MFMRSAVAGARGASAAIGVPRLQAVVDDAVWFEARTAAGALRLASLTGTPARHAADAALALVALEPLLAALEDWAGEALDWRWTLAPAIAAPGAEARAAWHGRVRLAVPWPWLRARRAPEPGPAAELDWAAVPAVLIAARLRLPAADSEALEPGGALLLPQSLLPAWHGVVRAVDDVSPEPAGAVVTLGAADAGGPHAPALAPGFDAAAALQPWGAADDALFELRLELPSPLAADRLAGWRAGAVGPAGPRACLWRCADARGSARRLASGRLMPWGDGWALAVETLGDAPKL